MLIGKIYIPRDNSYNRDLKTLNWTDLCNKETIIISQPYEEEFYSNDNHEWGRDEKKGLQGEVQNRWFVTVTRNGDLFRVIWNPGWVQEELNTNVIIIVKEYKK